MRKYQVVLDDGQFFYVESTSTREAMMEAIELVNNAEVHDRGEVEDG